MSSAVSAAEVQENFITICCGLSVTALLVYEYLITFDREYRLVWKRRFSAATFLFLLARYPLLLNNILTISSIYPPSTRSCSALVWLTTVSHLLFDFVVVAFSTLRVYALSGCQWKIAALAFIFSLVSFGINLFEAVRQVVGVAPPPINCTSYYSISPELLSILRYVPRATTIAAEMVVLAVTIQQTYWQRRAAAEANLRTPLHTVILRDGTVCFLVLLMMNMAEIVLAYLGDIFESSTYISQFVDPITTILISRFILNLREADASQCGTEDASRPSFVGSIQFATFVEPLGAPLDHGLSFSAIDVSSLDEQEADGENEDEDVLGNDEEVVSGRINVNGPSEPEAGPSRVRE